MPLYLPEKITTPEGNIALLVPDEQFDELMPPSGMDLSINGFMDRAGNTHYEVNITPWQYPTGFKKFLTLFYMKRFYMGIPGQLCARCLTKDPAELIGAGYATFFHQEQRVHLTFLGLRPRAEIPGLDSALRKEAIFRFQERYNRLVQWLGGTKTTTNTAIIPDHKMRALGWQRIPLNWRDYLKRTYQGFPGSLAGILRAYQIEFSSSATGNGV